MPFRKQNNFAFLLLGCLLWLVYTAQAMPLYAQTAPDDADIRQKQRPRRTNDATPAPVADAVPDAVPAATRDADAGDGAVAVGDDEIVRVKTQLVSVPAVVADRNGRILNTLTAKSFIVYEDGKAQQLANFATADAPFEVALLLDTSGSTRADIQLIRDAAQSFINSLRPGDRVALLAFSEDPAFPKAATEIKVLAPLTDDRALLRQKLKDMSGGSGTPFYDAMVRTVTEVFREPPAPANVGRRALVALTDGVDSSSKADFAAARAQLTKGGIASYFVQIDTEDYVEDRLLRGCSNNGALRLSVTQMQRFRKVYAARADAADFKDYCKLGEFARMEMSRALYDIARDEMKDLARVSGGRVFPVQGLDDAEAAFSEVAAEIGTQYSLGYYSSNKARDGAFRQIRVEVKGVPGAQVRAREGYVAPKE